MAVNLKDEFNNLCQLIDEHDVISFDIYDTVLIRNVLHPTDIFELISLQLSTGGIKEFKKIRISAEEHARANSKKEDISFEEIYRIICDELGSNVGSKFRDMELKLEKEFTTGNSFIYKIYEYALENKKKLVFISDMYLPKSFITSLLKENGFNEFVEVFISGELGVSKASTKLYDHVRKEMEISYQTPWLHIGDNFVSDYKNALQCRINAYHYKSFKDKIEVKKTYSLKMSIMKAIQFNYCESNVNLNYWEQLGITTVSSLYFGFALWLTEELKDKDNVYFLARDGYLPFKLYEKLSSIVDGLPEATYLYASRRAFQLPNIINMKKEEALELLTARNAKLGQKINLGEIFDNIGLDREKYTNIIRKAGFKNYEDNLSSEVDRIKAQNVLKEAYSDIERIFLLEKEKLLDYLNQNQIYKYHRLNIVDVGWRGSTHKAIKDLTGIPVEGYYFGTTYNVYDDIMEYVHGYAFNLGKPYAITSKIMNNVMMYEFIFSAPHETLVGFQSENGKITPILKDSVGNNHLSKCLEALHQSVLDVSEKYMKYYKYLIGVDCKEVLTDYMEFIDLKRYEDLKEFEDLTVSVGIGDAQEFQNFVTSVSIQEYRKNKKSIDECAEKNLWKGALIVRGSSLEFRRKLTFQLQFFRNLFSNDRIIKVIRNPRKAIKLIAKKIKTVIPS